MKEKLLKIGKWWFNVQEIKKYIVCFLAGVLCGYALFSGGNYGSRANTTRNQLESARKNQQQQSETIERIEQTRSELEDAEREAGNIIADSNPIRNARGKRNEN